MLPQIEYDKALLGKLKSNYFNAKVFLEMIQEQEKEIQRKILAENEFYEEAEIVELEAKHGGTGKPKRILKPNNSYMMSEDDFLKFMDLCYPEFVKAGIANPKGKEYCCDNEARELFHEATKQLVEYGISIMPDVPEKEVLRKAVWNIKWRDRVLDLVLKLESEEIESYV